MDPSTGEILHDPTAFLVVSPALLCVDGLFKAGSSADAWKDGPTVVDYDDDGNEVEAVHGGPGNRGEITEFSRGSQQRLMKQLACWQPEGQLYILTLTYPRIFPSTERAREDFNRFRRIMRREVPELAGMWKLEYQRRGAPHYHMVVQSGSILPDLARLRNWLDRAWMKARQSLEPARTQADVARDQDRARFYLAKEVGKMVQASAFWREQCDNEVKHVGRFWGWIGKEQLLFQASVVQVSAEAAWRFRRRVQEVVARSLVERKLLRRDAETGGLVKLDGSPMDDDGIPSWQLSSNAYAIAKRIVDELRADGVAIPPIEEWPQAAPPF